MVGVRGGFVEGVRGGLMPAVSVGGFVAALNVAVGLMPPGVAGGIVRREAAAASGADDESGAVAEGVVGLLPGGGMPATAC